MKRDVLSLSSGGRSFRLALPLHLIQALRLCHTVMESDFIVQIDPADEPKFEETQRFVPTGSVLILVDQDEWRPAVTHGRCRLLPFLERDGSYWGVPADDETAVGEMERMRTEGADFIAFARPCFWMLEHYKGFAAYLDGKFHTILQNERVVVFDLRSL